MIPIKFVKLVADTIVGPLIAIINNYIRKSYIPNAWEQPRISSIPKVDLVTAEKYSRQYLFFQHFLNFLEDW